MSIPLVENKSSRNLSSSPRKSVVAPNPKRARPVKPLAAADPEPLSPRERLIQTARRLFYREGLRAVGIDRVIAESGVAKMTLYRYFPSKDELIVACLEEHERDFWLLWDKEVGGGGTGAGQSNSGARIMDLIRFIARRTSDPAYQGCIFLNTAQSFPEKKHPAHHFAVQHKQSVLARLLKLTRDAGVRDPEALARQLLLLINGTQATAGMLGQQTQWAIVEAAQALLCFHGL
jgi:AcrR family transcriptional regulator